MSLIKWSYIKTTVCLVSGLLMKFRAGMDIHFTRMKFCGAFKGILLRVGKLIDEMVESKHKLNLTHFKP